MSYLKFITLQTKLTPYAPIPTSSLYRHTHTQAHSGRALAARVWGRRKSSGAKCVPGLDTPAPAQPRASALLPGPPSGSGNPPAPAPEIEGNRGEQARRSASGRQHWGGGEEANEQAPETSESRFRGPRRPGTPAGPRVPCHPARPAISPRSAEKRGDPGLAQSGTRSLLSPHLCRR